MSTFAKSVFPFRGWHRGAWSLLILTLKVTDGRAIRVCKSQELRAAFQQKLLEAMPKGEHEVVFMEVSNSSAGGDLALLQKAWAKHLLRESCIMFIVAWVSLHSCPYHAFCPRIPERLG